MRIDRVNKEDIEKVYDFVSKSIDISDIDKSIIENASYISCEDEIIGVLSFEKFSNIGLIRYFILKKSIPEEVILELLKSITKSALEKEIKKVIAIVEKDSLVSLFKRLGFEEISNDYVYIDEKSARDDNYKNSKILNLII